MYDFHTICRTCSLQGELLSLFIEQPYVIADILTEFANLKVVKDDNLPQNICKDCLESLKHAYEFKRQCQAVQTKFDEYIRSDYQGQDGIFIVSINDEIYENLSDISIEPPELKLNHIQAVIEEEKLPLNAEESVSITEIKPKICKMSNKNAGNQLLNHMRSHNRPKLKCEYCNKLFPYREMLRRHLRTHTGERPYKCPICHNRFSQLGSLNSHYLLHTGEKPHECTVCNKNFARKTSLTKHLMIHTNKKPYTCKICDKKFRQVNHLNAHMTRHTGERQYQCIECGKRFALNQTLKTHMRTHTGEYPYRCTCCSNTYNQLSALKAHMRVEHIGMNIIHRNKSLLCSYCGKKFLTRIGLRLHIITHTDEKPFKCPLCNKSFSRAQSLKIHETFHTGERKYKCGICDQRFKQSSHLRTHIRTHTGEKPHKCSYCDKCFAENSNLVVHMRIHTGEQPYVCSICNRGFYHLTTMKKHKLRHSHHVKDTTNNN